MDFTFLTSTNILYYLQVFAELPSLSFIKCASLIGHNNNQEMRTCQMQDTIAKFRDGRVCSSNFSLAYRSGILVFVCENQFMDQWSSAVVYTLCF